MNNVNEHQSRNILWIAVVLLFAGAVLRLLPHPANFAPMGAIALFGGVLFRGWKGYVIPLAALFLGDVFIGFYSWQVMVSVYGSFAVMSYIGQRVRGKGTLRLLGGTLIGSALFFLITNWAVWVFGTMYPHTLVGLSQSYIMALPFFRNTIAGDLFYTAVIFGAYHAVTWLHSYIVKKRIEYAESRTV